MVAAILATVLPAAIQAGSSYMGSRSAEKQAEQGRRGGALATYAQQQGLQRGEQNLRDAARISESFARAGYGKQIEGLQRGREDITGGLGRGISYLQPYMAGGEEAFGGLGDVLGYGGAGGQQNMLEMFRGSPRYAILQQAIDEAARRTEGQYSAEGLGRSGALSEELARRMSDIELGQYGEYEDLMSGVAATGATAAGRAAGLEETAAGRMSGLSRDIAGAEAGGDLAAADLQGQLGAYLASLGIRGGEVAGGLPVTQANLGMRATGAQQSYLSDFMGTAGSVGADLLSRYANRERQPVTEGWDPYVTAG